ncbi:MAG: SpaA isopeptide-forming pilin-related protein [Eggerthellaceae bacterium]|nr:SpaA isopeptide-forming pilin-related protein [Eggerthellaceae bacterium]
MAVDARGRWKRAWARGALALFAVWCALWVGAAVPASAWANPPDAGVTAASSPEGPLAYVRAHADERLVGAGDLRPVDAVTVEATLVDADSFFGSSLDDLWADHDGDGVSDQWESLTGNSFGAAVLYAAAPDAPCLVGRIDHLGSTGARLLQVLAGRNDTSGTLYNDVCFDVEAGLVYVPKTHLADGLNSVRVQVLYAVSAQADVPVRAQVESAGASAGDWEVEAHPSAADTRTELSLVSPNGTKPVAGQIDAVRINGVRLDESSDLWSYDARTGALSIELSPVQVGDVRVEVSDGLVKAAARAARSLVPAAYAGSLPDLGVVWKASGAPADGSTFAAAAENIYGRNQGVVKGARPNGADPDDLAREVMAGAGVSLDDFSTSDKFGFHERGSFIREQDIIASDGTKIRLPAQSVQLYCAHIGVSSDGWGYSNDKHYGNVPTSRDERGVFVRVLQVRDDSMTIAIVSPTMQTQAGVGLFSVRWEGATGAIELQKEPTDRSVAGSASCYGMAGAVYGIFRDEGCSDAAGEIVLDEAGWGRADGLAPGRYFLKETAAPSSGGFALSDEVIPVDVESGGVYHATAKEQPLYGRGEALLQKVDALTGAAQPQGDASLAGAEFAVRYYDRLDGSAEGDPARTWVLRSDEDGYVAFDAAHLVSGEGFFADDQGEFALPLGTYTVAETKAPVGYARDTAVRTVLLAPDGAGSQAVWKTVGDAWGSFGAERAEGRAVGDRPQQGDYRLVKTVAIPQMSAGQTGEGARADDERVLVPGLLFQILNDSAAPVVSPQTGKLAAPGEVVCTIACDADGLASTRNAQANGWAVPDGWSGALAYGSYRVREVVPDEVGRAFREDHGFEVPVAAEWKIRIGDDGAYDEPTLVTDRAQSPLKIVKLDAETGRQVPLSCSFQLFDRTGALVTYAAPYPDAHTMDTWTTNAKGELTLPMLLAPGVYTIKEVRAPEGYLLSADPVPVTIDGADRSWDQPVLVSVGDRPAKGAIEVRKQDASTGEALAGAAFEVRAAADIVTPDGTVRAKAGDRVAQMTTDRDGIARTGELYLGTYTVREVAAPSGWALDDTPRTVTLAYQGQDVPIALARVDVSDAPSTLKLRKVDAATGQALAGAQFRIWSDQGFEGSFASDEDGWGKVEQLVPGSYHLQESGVPEGYEAVALDEETGAPALIDFTVNEDGLVGQGDGPFSACLELVVENAPGEIGTHAQAQGDGRLLAPDEEATIVDTVTYDNAVLGKEYTVMGTLHVREVDDAGAPVDAGPLLDDAGEPVTATARVVPTDRSGSVEVTFTFDASALAGRTVVVFEEMRSDRLFAVHADIADEGQSVEVAPAVRTELVNAESGEHVAVVSDEGTLVLTDTVSVEGLQVGTTYLLRGTLMKRDSGEPVMNADGTPVTGTAEFEAQASDDQVEVAFSFDAGCAGAGSVVAFEELYEREADAPEGAISLVARHADLADDHQTVTIEEMPPSDTPPSVLAKTADALVRGWPLLALAFAALATAIVSVGRLRR